MSFQDRVDAGRRLARALGHLAGEDVVVLGLPRGGVPVAFEVAAALGAPLDVIVVRKIGVPFQPELALGAIGEGGVVVANEEVMAPAGHDRADLDRLAALEEPELRRRTDRFRGVRPRVPLAGRTAVVVDDGVATGSTARAACRVAREQGARRVVLAVPVAARESADELRRVADEVVCLEIPEHFYAVGERYRDFAQVSDDEVVRLLGEAEDRLEPAVVGNGFVDPPGRDEEVELPLDDVRLGGHLAVPAGARGLVLFAHGSGSSRHSPRNRYVARVLNERHFATVLFDLLTIEEEPLRSYVFDIDLLAGRLGAATRWTGGQPGLEGLPVGYFGASTGAAAALVAAAAAENPVAAVVARGGRPDLAGQWLADVRAPTLLIVGGHDEQVAELNRHALAKLRCERRLVVVPGAGHLFTEEGSLAIVAGLAADWFAEHLVPGAVARASWPPAAPGSAHRPPEEGP